MALLIPVLPLYVFSCTFLFNFLTSFKAAAHIPPMMCKVPAPPWWALERSSLTKGVTMGLNSPSD